MALGLEDLFRSHWTLVYRFLLRRTGDPALAEELAQETSYRATRAFLGWRGGSPGAWLLAIARHALIDEVRRGRRLEPLDEMLLDSGEAAGDDAGVAEALASLPDAQRRLLELVYVFGYSHAEVAVILDTTEGAVKTSVWRARQLFRAEYEREAMEGEAMIARATGAFLVTFFGLAYLLSFETGTDALVGLLIAAIVAVTVGAWLARVDKEGPPDVFDERATRRAVRRGIIRTALVAVVWVVVGLTVLDIAATLWQTRGDRDEHLRRVAVGGFSAAHPGVSAALLSRLLRDGNSIACSMPTRSREARSSSPTPFQLSSSSTCEAG